MQMPSREEFVEMTSTSNGHYLNGHDSVPGYLEGFFFKHLLIKMKLNSNYISFSQRC